MSPALSDSETLVWWSRLDLMGAEWDRRLAAIKRIAESMERSGHAGEADDQHGRQ